MPSSSLPSKISTSQVTLSNTAVLLVAERVTRKKLIILSPGGYPIVIGDSTVTASSGCVLPYNSNTAAGIGDFEFTGAVYGLLMPGSLSAIVSILELYD